MKKTPEGYCVDPVCGCHGTVMRAKPCAAARAAGLSCCTRCFRNGKMPLTVVAPSASVSVMEMEQRVVRTRDTHGPLLLEYHRIWYESGHTWPFTFFLGVGLMKNPNDLWIYQDLMTHRRPTTVIETGTYSGASALWFAFLMDMLNIKGGRVLTIDIDDHKDKRITHPRITFLRGSSTDPKMLKKVLKLRQPGPVLISLDADHSERHVYEEMCLYAPHVGLGDFLVVEDTNVGWAGPNGTGDRGARGGVEDYLREHPGEFTQDILAERYLLTMNPGGWLQRIAPARP